MPSPIPTTLIPPCPPRPCPPEPGIPLPPGVPGFSRVVEALRRQLAKYDQEIEEIKRTHAGENGRSAYEIAVAHGYPGTEAEWLESLEGAPGPAGSQGPAGADGRAFTYDDMTPDQVLDLASRVGRHIGVHKADKVEGATAGNVATLDASGNLADGGVAPSALQRALTFDQTPVAGSQNPVTSEGIAAAIMAAVPSDYDTVKAQVQANAGAIAALDAHVPSGIASGAKFAMQSSVSAIEEKIPSQASAQDKLALQSSVAAVEVKIPAQASAQNQLADKDFVNSSVATNTATFRDTYNLVTDLSLSVSATEQQVATALEAEIGAVADNNDYCFVQVPTADATPSEVSRIDRYKCRVEESGGAATRTWSYEFSLNNSSFTAAQWAAINSGITAAAVQKLSGVEAGAQANVVEGVTVNGTPVLPDAGKTVALAVPETSGDILLPETAGDTSDSVVQGLVKWLQAEPYTSDGSFSRGDFYYTFNIRIVGLVTERYFEFFRCLRTHDYESGLPLPAADPERWARATVQDLLAAIMGTAMTADAIPTATGSVLGGVRLSDSLNSSAGVTGGYAATPKAVRLAYEQANTARSIADYAYQLLPYSLSRDAFATIRNRAVTYRELFAARIMMSVLPYDEYDGAYAHVLDWYVDVKNVYAGTATLEFSDFGSGMLLVTESGQTLAALTTFAQGEMARLHFTETAFLGDNLERVFLLTRTSIASVTPAAATYSMEADGTVSTEGTLNEDGTLSVEGMLNEDGTLTVEAQ